MIRRGQIDCLFRKKTWNWSHLHVDHTPVKVSTDLEPDWVLFKLNRLVVFGTLPAILLLWMCKYLLQGHDLVCRFSFLTFFLFDTEDSVENWILLDLSRLYRHIHIIDALSIDTWQCLLPLHLHTVQVTVTSDFSQLSRFWYPVKRVPPLQGDTSTALYFTQATQVLTAMQKKYQKLRFPLITYMGEWYLL